MSEMNGQKKKLALREGLALMGRALKLINTFTPNYLLHMFLFSAGHNLGGFVGIWFGARILDELTGARNWTTLTILVLAMCALMLGLILMSKYSWRRVRVNEIISAAWEDSALNAKSFSLDYEDMEDPEVRDHRQGIADNWSNGGLGALMMAMVWVMCSLINLVTSAAMMAGLFFLRAKGPLTGLLAFFNSPWAAALLAALLLGSILYITRASRKESPAHQADMKELPRIQRTLHYYLDEYLDDSKAGKDLRVYSQRELIQASYSEIFGKYLQVNKRILGYRFRLDERSGLLQAAMQGMVYLLVACRAMAGAFGVGSLVKYVALIESFIGSALGLGGALAWLWENNEQIQRFFDYLDRQTKMSKGGLPVDASAPRHEIAFHDVSFRYPGQEDYALRHFSLKFHVGERLAVVGRNGSGKTTMIKLLCRLYDPIEGRITLDGVDIREVDYEQYQALFSVVFQDFRLFSFGLGQNVAASDTYDAHRAADCLEKAGLGERLSTLPDGLETAIYKDFDENGVEVSGGEAQKIAIARALYKDAPFVILDEPTAALDPIAEHEIYARFDEIIGEKTAVYISHRLSSCRFCHKIAVLRAGELAQIGSHEELLGEADGPYAKLWNAQAQYYAYSHEEQSIGGTYATDPHY